MAAASAHVQRVLDSDGQLLDAIQLRLKPARPSRVMVAAAVAMGRDDTLVPMALGLNGGSQTRATQLKDRIVHEGLLALPLPGSITSTAMATPTIHPQQTMATLPDKAAAFAAGWCCPPLELPQLAATPLPPKNAKMYYQIDRLHEGDKDQGKVVREWYTAVSSLSAPMPEVGDGYSSLDQLHIKPEWICQNKPGIAEVRVGPLFNPGDGATRAMRCVRARLRQYPFPTNEFWPGTHEGIICLCCAGDLIVSSCDDYPEDSDPPSDAEYKAWTKAASRTCDYCFLA